MVARKKQEALEAQQLMQETYERKKDQEERDDGMTAWLLAVRKGEERGGGECRWTPTHPDMT